MNKSILTISLITTGLMSIQLAAAEERDNNPTGIYLGANIGAAFFENDGINKFDDAGLSLGAQIGYRWNDHFRTELEIGGAASGVENSDDVIAYGSYNLNGFYDFLPPSEAFVPYVGAGIGYAAVALDSDNGDQDDSGLLSLHGEVGLAMNVNEHFAIVPSYRYTVIEEDDEGILDDDLASHAVRVGLRVSF